MCATEKVYFEAAFKWIFYRYRKLKYTQITPHSILPSTRTLLAARRPLDVRYPIGHPPHSWLLGAFPAARYLARRSVPSWSGEHQEGIEYVDGGQRVARRTLTSEQ